MKIQHTIVIVSRSVVLLCLFAGSSAFLRCATSPTTKPTPNSINTDAGNETNADAGNTDAEIFNCNTACANIEKLDCKYWQSCSSACSQISNPTFFKCVTQATTCLIADGCNQPKN